MSKLAAIDLVFLLLENQNSPTHMSSCLIFEPPCQTEEHVCAKVGRSLACN